MNRKHILIVDDQVDFTEVLALRLQAHDYKVSVAHTGRDAIKKAFKEKPDLILLDIVLPKVSGYQICHRLRENKTTHDIPIIMITGQTAPNEKIEGLYLGADDFITKPFDAEELLARINTILRRRQTFEERKMDKAAAIAEIKRIIYEDLIIPHFQPIYYLRPHKLLGLEVLSRHVKGGLFNNPEVLFDTAFHLGMLLELEMACHKKALSALGELAKKNLVFFNVSPYLIQENKFKEFSSVYSNYTKNDRIVFELTERRAVKDFKAFYKLLEGFKKSGFKIAIDDIGSGYASLNSIVEIKPNFIKIDAHIIRDIYSDKVRKNLLKALVNFAKESRFITVAEGIETKEELDTLVEFDIDCGQGYFLCRPTPKPKEILCL